ncbi:replication initiation protein, partial [Agitococcus lubricus]
MLKNELQVVKSNQVIEASYQLSTIEQRLVLAAISHIPKGQTVTDEVLYTVSVADLQLLGVNQTTAYRDIKEGVNKLYERSICNGLIEQDTLIGSIYTASRGVYESNEVNEKA